MEPTSSLQLIFAGSAPPWQYLEQATAGKSTVGTSKTTRHRVWQHAGNSQKVATQAIGHTYPFGREGDEDQDRPFWRGTTSDLAGFGFGGVSSC